MQNYGETLAKEAGGAILAWAIQGAGKFIQDGYKLCLPESVKKVTEAYRKQEDWLASFIRERCVRQPTAKAGARNLYLAYKSWAMETGEYVRRENDFSAAMTAACFEKVKIAGKPTYQGLFVDNRSP